MVLMYPIGAVYRPQSYIKAIAVPAVNRKIGHKSRFLEILPAASRLFRDKSVAAFEVICADHDAGAVSHRESIHILYGDAFP